MKVLIRISLCAFVATSMFAQGFGFPPGKWWQIPRVAQRLELTRAQQDQLDGVFRRSAPVLIDLKAELEKATIALRGAVDRTDVDRENVRAAAAAVSEARAALFERELMMLLDMREVLDEKQWNLLRQALDERRDGMRERERFDGRRPRPGMKRPG